MRNKLPPSNNTIIGFGGGTTLAGIGLALDDGWLKTIILIATPAITIIIGKLWFLFMNRIDDLMNQWDLNSAIRDLEKQMDTLSRNENTDPSVLDKARITFNELVEIRVSHRLERIKLQNKRK